MGKTEVLNQKCRILRWRLLWVLFLRYCCSRVGVFFFVWGIVILAAKALTVGGLIAEKVLCGGLLVFLPLGWAWYSSWRRMPSQGVLKAVLDNYGNAGGLLTASEELALGEWSVKAVVRAVPQVSWNWKRGTFLLTSGLAFVIAAVCIPPRSAQAARPVYDISRELTELQEKLVVLQEEQVINEQQVQEYQKDIEKLDQRRKDGDAAGLWEALDHLDSDLKKTAEQKANELLRQIQESAAVRAAAESLAGLLDKLDKDVKAQAGAELAEMAARAITPEDMKNLGLTPEQMKELLEQMANQCDAGQLSQMQQMMSQCQGGKFSKMGKMGKCKLINPSMLKKMEKMSQCDKEALAAYLSQCKKGGLCQALCSCNKPGRGGVNRGRCDAQLTWKDPTAVENMKFREEQLPPGAFSSAENSELQGMSIGDPGTEAQELESGSGALSGTAAQGGSGMSGVVLPAHRKIVKNYFERTKE